MKKQALVTLALVAATLGAAAGGEPAKVYWQEDFSRFEVGPAGGFGENCVIREQRGRKYLHGTGWMLGGMDYFGARNWKGYSFRFRFRFTDPQKTDFYPLVKSRGKRGDVKYLWYYVRFARDSLHFTCHGLAKALADQHKTPSFTYQNAGLDALEAGTWYAAEMQVTHDRIRVHLSRDGSELMEIARINTVPGDGGVDILSYNPIDIADIIVQQLPPRTD